MVRLYSFSIINWAPARMRTNSPAPLLTPTTLSGNVVKLEPLEERHFEGLSSVAFDESLWLYTMTRVSNAAELQTYVRAALEMAATGTALPFVTILKAEDRIIGSTRLANYDRENRRVEIGWSWLGSQYQRTGANVEAKLLMMTHAFEELGCNRVEFKTDVLNTKSRNALLGIGATEEGVLRQHVLLWNGRWRDSIYYSVLASEWPRVKERLQQRLNRTASPQKEERW
jgi:N-acetyltransferase